MYTAEISRDKPSCFLFLIDQSGSMADSFGAGEGGKRKADALADAINRLLQNLVLKCTKSVGDDGIRDYYHVAVIGYGDSVGPAFSGPLAGRDLVRISEVANLPARIEQRAKRVEDGAGGLVDQTVRFPIWFDPRASGGTPMCAAISQAQSLVESWLVQHPDCFPPIVINISDGEPTDGDPTSLGDKLRAASSIDGNVLLFNVHISSQTAAPIEFADSEAALPDDHARLLFRMSSLLPPHLKDAAKQEGITVSEGTRGFVFNADMVSVIKFLDIGTRPSSLR
jgi:hypothetical protein